MFRFSPFTGKISHCARRFVTPTQAPTYFYTNAFTFILSSCSSTGKSINSVRTETVAPRNTPFVASTTPDVVKEQEPEIDPTMLGGKWYEFEGLKVIIPSEFVVNNMDDSGIKYACASSMEHPELTDNITFTLTNENFKDYTESVLKYTMESTSQEYGWTVEDFRFSRYPASKTGNLYDYTSVSYDLVLEDGQTLSQINNSYFFSGKTVTVVYTYAGERPYFADVYAMSMDMVRFA